MPSLTGPERKRALSVIHIRAAPRSSSFELRITPLGRDTSTYPYNGIKIGQSPPLLGTPGVGTGTFRVPVLARNTETRIILRSDSPLPCRFQSAEWEGMLHTRARRM